MPNKLSKLNVPITTTNNGTITTTATEFEIHDPSALTSIDYDTTNAKFTKSVGSGAAQDVVACADEVVENSVYPITSGAVYDTLGDIDAALAAILQPVGSVNNLTVNATAGSSISITKGQTTITGKATSGSFTTELPEAGVWTITATLNGSTAVDAIDISDDFEISMTYFSATINITTAPNASITATSGYLTLTATANSSGVATLTVNKSGTYSIHASKDSGSSTTESVAATTNGGSYNVSLPMASITLTNCDTTGATLSLTDGTTTIDGGTYTGSPKTVYLSNLGNWTLTVSDTIKTKTKSLVVSSYTDYSVSLNLYTTIYGVSWDKTSTTQLSRTDAAANFSNPVPYMADGSHPGSSPFDTLMPWSGMTTETINGNVLVKIPKFWYKITNTSNAMTIQIADGEVDGFMVSPAHQDKGDGVGERDYVYIGRYKCGGSNYKSTTGTKPRATITRETARDGCRKQGGSSNIDGFYQQDFAMFWTIRLLYIVEFANWNSQAVIGNGCGDSSSVVNTGATDSMPYHTGTMQSSRGYGNGTQYRYIEGLWDNVREWCDGIYFGSTSKATIYIIKNPNNFSDTSGGQSTGTRHTSGEYITDFSVPSASGYEWALYPMHTNNTGGENTYVADYCNYDSSGGVLSVGGFYSPSQGCGMFYLSGDYYASYASATIGCRLQYLPS